MRAFGKRGRWLIVLAAIAVGSCAGMSDAQRNAEEAKNILPSDYKSDVIAFLRTYLNDPTNIRTATISQPQLATIEPFDRYVVCLRFNAKTGAGQYAGVKDSLAIFILGKLDRLIELERVGASPQELARNKPLRDFCGAAAYQPFPELERLRR